MWVDGTETDGPLIVELGINPIPPPPDLSKFLPYAVNSRDLGVAKTGEPIRPNPYPGVLHEWIIFQGETSLTNAQIFDHRAGTGLVADAWMMDPVYRMGTNSKPNTCYDLIEWVLARMSLRLDPVTKRLFENSTEYYTSYSRHSVRRVPLVASFRTEPAGPDDKVQTRVFDVDFEMNPDAPSLIYDATQDAPPIIPLLHTLNQPAWGTRNGTISLD
ncbi:MAG: hypothetical protein Q9219_002509 [cf. Caloplaca sp. 3 TL-2023]